MKIRLSSTWQGACWTLIVFLGITAALYWSTATATAAAWSRNPLGQGYLVLPGALWLAWGRRKELALSRPEPAFWILPALGILSFLWLLGRLTNTDVVQQSCLVGIFMCSIVGVLGVAAARTLLFPLAFLMFALPIGDLLIPSLQDFTARLAVKMLEASGVPVLLEGHVISIPGSKWTVADACSGINYLMSSVAVGYVYAGTVYRTWTHRLGFFVASAVLPLVANALRVYGTILAASLGMTQLASGMHHYLFGWMVFVLTIGVLFGTCGHWGEPQPQRLVDQHSSEVEVSDTTDVSRRLLAFGSVATLMIGLAPVSVDAFFNRQPGLATISAVPVAEVALPWRPVDRDLHAWDPHFVAPASELRQTYEAGGRRVKLYIASYGPYQAGVKLAANGNTLFDPTWQIGFHGRRQVIVAHQVVDVAETVVQSEGLTLVVWNWYRVGQRLTGSDIAAKLLLAKAKLLRSSESSAAGAAAILSEPGMDTSSILRDFLEHASRPLMLD